MLIDSVSKNIFCFKSYCISIVNYKYSIVTVVALAILGWAVYKIAKNLEEDLTTDRTLGFSIEGMTLKTDKNDLVSQFKT